VLGRHRDFVAAGHQRGLRQRQARPTLVRFGRLMNSVWRAGAGSRAGGRGCGVFRFAWQQRHLLPGSRQHCKNRAQQAYWRRRSGGVLGRCRWGPGTCLARGRPAHRGVRRVGALRILAMSEGRRGGVPGEVRCICDDCDASHGRGVHPNLLDLTPRPVPVFSRALLVRAVCCMRATDP